MRGSCPETLVFYFPKHCAMLNLTGPHSRNFMKTTKTIFMLCCFFLITTASATNCMPTLPSMPKCNKNCSVDVCCGKMGGISYCDSSAGRYVCNNGFYSSCYCTRHAVMDLQHLEGCCLWQGGVLNITPEGLVICNNGGASTICTMMRNEEKVAVY